MSKSWVCKECSEKIDKEFDTCWNCGYSIVGKSNSNDNIDRKKFLKDKKNIEKELYGDIQDFLGLHTYSTIIFIAFIIYFVAGIALLILGILDESAYLIVAGLICLLTAYISHKQIKIIDFLFFLNKKIDRLKKKN